MIKWFLFVLILTGCQTKTLEVVRVKEVLIPIPCQNDAPKKPNKTGNIVQDALSLALYAKDLEIAFYTCKE